MLKWLKAFCNLRPLGQLKGMSMKTMAKNLPSLGIRRGVIVAGVFIALVLTACGGGGSASNLDGPFVPDPVVTPPPVTPPVVTPPSVVGTVTSTKNCEILATANKCLAEVGLDVSASATNPTLTVDSKVISLTSGVQIVSVELSGPTNETVVLKNGDGTVLDGTKSVGSACVASAPWDAPWKFCRAILPSYSDYVLSVWGIDGTFFIVSKTGVKAVTNMTPWQLPTAGLFNCGLRKTNNPDKWGGIHGDCQDSVTLKDRPVMINPETGEVSLSSPVPPDSPDYVVGNPADYLYADPGDPSYTFGHTQAKVMGGSFYAAYNPFNQNDSSIYFRSDTAVVSLVPGGAGTVQANGNVKLLKTFKHTQP